MRLGLVAAILVLALGACATKRYPIASQLSPVESAQLNCRELSIEADRVATTRAQIADTGNTDWRSAAGFLGDFGIGNAMARSEAESALANRDASIRQAQAARRCNGAQEPAS